VQEADVASRRPRFALKLFGGPVLREGDVRIPLSPMETLLLGFVGAHGADGVNRESACELLWGRGTRSERRQRLAQLVHSTRRKVDGGDLLLTEGARLFLHERDVDSDLVRFETAMAHRDFGAAMELVEGEFLADVEQGVSQEFSEWLATARVDFRGRVREGIARELQQAQDEERQLDVAKLSLLLLRLDPDDEDMLRIHLRASATSGGVADARAAFRRFQEGRRALDPDWGPEPETEQLLGRLEGLLASERYAVLRQRALVSGDTPLVERTRALDLVHAAVAGPDVGQASSLLVEGAPGTGKSTLCRIGLSHAMRSGNSTLHFDGQAFIGIDPACDTPLDWGRWYPCDEELRLIQELRTWLLSIAPKRRVVVVLDDADSLPPNVLESLLKLTLDALCPGIVAIAARSSWSVHADPTGGHQLLHRFPRATLKNLSTAATAELVKAISPPSISWDIANLVKYTGGNPEAVRLVVAARSNEPTIDSTVAEQSAVAEMIRRRVARGPKISREVLSVLATGDSPWSAEGITAALTSSVSETSEALHYLASLDAARPSEGQWVLGATMYRRWIHSDRSAELTLQRTRTAEFMERSGLQPSALAQAWSLAGDSMKTLEYSQIAADVSRRAGDTGDRVVHLKRALSTAADPATEHALKAQLARAFIDAREFSAALPLLREEAKASLEAGHQGEWLSVQARIVDAQGHLDGVDPTSPAQEAEELFATAVGFDAIDQAARCLDLALHFYHRGADEAGVRRVFLAAERLLASAQANDVRIQLHTILAVKAYYGCELDGLRHARSSVQLARASNDHDLKLAAMNRLLAVLIARGLLGTSEGRLLIPEVMALCAKAESLLAKTHPIINLAVWDAECGNYDSAIAQLQRLLPSVDAAQDQRPAVLALCNLGIAHLRSGAADVAHRYLQSAERRMDRWSSAEVRTQVLSGLAWCALEEGRMGEASSILRSIEKTPVQSSADVTTHALCRCRYLRRSGKARDAVAVMDQAIAESRERFPVHFIDLVVQRRLILPPGIESRRWREEEIYANTLAQTLDLSIHAARLRVMLRGDALPRG
jgi:DNA-binding SARP family transcriptional activator/predicted negative regulator of RcsB-dependent stress response